MGSSSSAVEVPKDQKIDTPRRADSRAPSRNRGFQEVQFQTPGGASASSSGSTPSRRPQRRDTNKDYSAPAQRSSNKKNRKQSDDQEFSNISNDSDIHSVVNTMQREKTMAEFEQPQYNPEDMVLETFCHRNGSQVSCLFQGGKRYFLDSWQSQDWQPFPKKWYKEGILITDRVIKNDNEQNKAPKGQRQSGNIETDTNLGIPNSGDDREGEIEHSTKGKVSTYIFEEKRNVHYFFDKNSGSWVRLSVASELKSELIQKLMAPIEEALPDWKDRCDMLAALRACNYDPHECISTYLAQGEEGIPVPKNAKEAKLMEEKDNKLRELEEQIKKLSQAKIVLMKKLEEDKHEKEESQKLIEEMRERVSSLEVDLAQAMVHTQALQRERPKTAKSMRSITPVEPENQVDPDTLEALQQNAKDLHKDLVKLRMESKESIDYLRNLLKQLVLGVVKIGKCDSGIGVELTQMKELYRKEALQRKLLYNKLQELRGNIRVFARCRYDARTDCCLNFPTDQQIVAPGQSKPYKFDKVFTPQSTQDEVFEDTLPIITSCVDGYNVCIMAYGQTGSGKTFTMQGPPDSPGVNVRSMRELLRICAERENIDYTLKASMIEIYNETIQDLLTQNANVLDLKAVGNKIHLPNLVEMFVETLEDIDEIIELGQRNRKTAATNMNSQSSRSHLLFMITVEGKDQSSGAIATGTLTLCDLAGSERVSKTDATGQRLVEAAAINKSLSALGQVFTALRTGQLHIPYRNSKLTHVLQPCLGGDAKACLFVALSPDINNVQESIGSLTFGSNARQVALGQAKKNVKM